MDFFAIKFYNLQNLVIPKHSLHILKKYFLYYLKNHHSNFYINHLLVFLNCLQKNLFLFLINKTTVFVQVAIKVFEPRETIEIISKLFSMISRALYKFKYYLKLNSVK